MLRTDWDRLIQASGPETLQVEGDTRKSSELFRPQECIAMSESLSNLRGLHLDPCHLPVMAKSPLVESQEPTKRLRLSQFGWAFVD